MSDDICTLTYVGGPTVLIEAAGVRFLTDPTFDEAGGAYQDGPVLLNKLRGPAVGAEALGRIDAILLSHDQHADNLDRAGRAVLSGVGRTLTTTEGATRLGGRAEGLAPWATTQVGPVTITAVPAQHGPDGTGALTGPVIGFVLTWPAQTGGAIYVSGDTVPFPGLADIADRCRIGLALIHMGHVQVEPLGDARLSFSAEQAFDFARTLGAHTLVPLHYEDWAHFRQAGDAAKQALAGRDGPRVVWLGRGAPTPIRAPT